MRALCLTGDTPEAVVLKECTAAWERLHARIAHRFGRTAVRSRVRRSLAGLLNRVERKNDWQLAEAICATGPQGAQRLRRSAMICGRTCLCRWATETAASASLMKPAFLSKEATRVA
jgi:hypothetical protein